MEHIAYVVMLGQYLLTVHRQHLYLELGCTNHSVRLSTAFQSTTYPPCEKDFLARYQRKISMLV